MQIRQMDDKVQATPTVSSINKLYTNLTDNKFVVYRRQVRKHLNTATACSVENAFR